MKRIRSLFSLLPCAAALCFSALSPAHSQETVSVAPIRWERFAATPKTNDTDLRACRRLLQNSVRYNLGWIEKTYTRDDARRMYVVGRWDENGIRPPCSAVYGIAVLLQTGGYDAVKIGRSEQEARADVAALIKGVAAVHKANASDPKKAWGDQWQSALWAGLLGHAGWLLWDDLDSETRRMLQRVIEHEADRFIAPGYTVPYWIAPDGKVNFPGDTKAEENAWNSTVLQVALAMLPGHPHTDAWRQVADELMVSAFAQKKDEADDKTRIDGKTLKDWLRGYNVRDDGAVINHNRLHPDYMATPTLNLRSYLVQSLAGQPVLAASRFNAEVPYRAYVLQSWPVPPNKSPGGTIYRPGEADIYYPTGTDWSTHRYDIYYLYDLFADRFHFDAGLPHSSREWLRLRAEKMLRMQARHPDGRLYDDGEFDSYAGREQLALWQLGDALLLQWLDSKGIIP